MAEVQLPTRKDLETKYNISGPTQIQKNAPTQPVISGPVIRKKKPLGKRVAKMLIGSDIPDIWQYILNTTIIPSIQNMICEIPQIIFFGKASPRSSYNAPFSNGQYTNYSRISFSQENKPRTDMYGRPIQEKRNYMFDDIIFRTAEEAETVRSHMYDIIQSFGYVTVAQLNEMMRLVPSVTDYDWGWRSLGFSEIRHVREGYLLDLPKAIYLK